MIAPPCERVAVSTLSTPTRANRRGPRSRGQSVTEFAIILPVMLAFLGLAIDFARVFQAWITLESATRDAAEAVATDTTVTTSTQALDLAKRTVCLQAQNVPGFTRSGLTSPDDVELCTAPTVSITTFTVSPTATGASTKYPLGTAAVQVSLPFRPLFAYPLITQNGTWTIVTTGTFSILRGRQ